MRSGGESRGEEKEKWEREKKMVMSGRWWRVLVDDDDAEANEQAVAGEETLLTGAPAP